MIARRGHALLTAVVFVDLVAISASYSGAVLLRFCTPLFGPAETPIPLERYFGALPVVLLGVIAVFASLGLYRADPILKPRAATGELIRGAGVAVLTLLALSALYRDASFSRVVFGLFFGLLAVFLPPLRSLAHRAGSWLRRGVSTAHAALIVGEGEVARRTLAALQAAPWAGLRVLGVVAPHDAPVGDSAPRDDEAPTARAPGAGPLLGGLGELAAIVERERVREVIIALPLALFARVDDIERRLRRTSAEVHLVLDPTSTLSVRPRIDALEDLAILTLRGGPAHGWHRVLKRAFDLVLGAAALALVAPLLAAAALAILLTDGAPVLFRQTRIGWGGRPFSMLKLRTMRRDAEQAGAAFAKDADPRATRLGRLLRKLSIDELPQLWNVLRGDMSLVGPRPERPELLPEIEARIPDYPLRLAVKAGITGWAQIHGQRGGAPLEGRLRLDLDYMRRWSLGLDAYILVRTALGGFLAPPPPPEAAELAPAIDHAPAVDSTR